MLKLSLTYLPLYLKGVFLNNERYYFLLRYSFGVSPVLRLKNLQKALLEEKLNEAASCLSVLFEFLRATCIETVSEFSIHSRAVSPVSDLIITPR